MTTPQRAYIDALHTAYTLYLPKHQAAQGHANAAVLVALCYHQHQWCFLITRRALHLRHHPGQLSFPGGRLDQGETAWQAAQRELTEETGITADFIKLWGALPAINTSTGFIVQPYLAELTPGYQLTLSRDEVDSVLYLPVDDALWSPNWVFEHWQLRQRQQPLHFLAIGSRLLWGASAHMLRQLSAHLSPSVSP